jgi:hypothetical protein
MNADELRSRRREIVELAAGHRKDIDECLSELESLDAAAKDKRPAYYGWLVDFETLLRLFKAAEGRPDAQANAADMMIGALERFKQTLPKEIEGIK